MRPTLGSFPSRLVDASADWILEARTPDYQLTPASPLWMGVHYHSTPVPPATSVHLGVEVGMVLSGREEVHIDGHIMGGGPGEVWLCAISEPHRLHIMSGHTRNLVLVFLPCFLGEEMLGDISWMTLFASPPAERPRVRDPNLRKTMLAIGRELQREAEQKSNRWQYAVRLELLKLLLHLSRTWDPPTFPLAHGQIYAGNLSRIMPALTLLHELPAAEVSRSEAARVCGVGRSRFTALFRETMGTSFVNVRQRIRLAHAADLLLSSSASIENIAEQTGFSDASHLHRCFVREYGCTPGQHRDRTRRMRKLR